MKTLVYAAPEKVEVREMPVPEPKEGQVRIRVSYCGICGSDIGIFAGKHPRAKAPLVLGHEFIGTIDAINGGSGKFNVGDRVIITTGSSARRMLKDDGIPVDAVVVGIIDEDCTFGQEQA